MDKEKFGRGNGEGQPFGRSRGQGPSERGGSGSTGRNAGGTGKPGYGKFSKPAGERGKPDKSRFPKPTGEPGKPDKSRFPKPAGERGNPGNRYSKPMDERGDKRYTKPQAKPLKPARPSGPTARRVALDALAEVTRVKAYATLALSDHLRAARNLSSEDKRFATMLFYAALENRLRISWVLGQFVASMPEPVIEDILHIAVAQVLFMDRVPDFAAVDEAVKQTRALGREQFVPLVNGALRNLLRARDAGEIHYPAREDDPVKYISVMHSLPEALSKRLMADYGMDEAERMIAYRPDERTQTVRPNLLRFDDTQFVAYADQKNWRFEKGSAQHALKLTSAGDLASDPDYKAGLFTIQGEGSMLAALAVEPKRAENILDACAAPGGKSALIAELMGLTGRVQAWDVHEHRVELLRAVKQRLRLDNLRPMVRDASIHREDCEMAYDAVLVDAPCTGLGVMVNKPDIKYRVREEDIEALCALQKKILDACARYPRVGGRLIYSTCTVLKDENERQIKAFLERHPEYTPDPSTDWLPDALKARFKGGCLQLQAHEDGMEGFFIARMVRTRP